MVNAVYHRSYEIREPVEVRVLPDSITVVSYPGPDRSIRLEDLETGHFAARRYRNRRIGEFLQELKLTEGRGTGIPKILKAMKANGSPKPRFETDDDRTYFLATFPIHVHGKIMGKQGQVRVTGEVTGEVLKFLAILDSPLTRMEIQKALGLKGQANFRDRCLRPSMYYRKLPGKADLGAKYGL